MSYPGGNGWPEQPQQPQPYQQSHPEPYQQSYPQPYQQAYEQDGLYQPYQQYQQYSGYAGGPPPPKKRKNGLLIGVGALVLVIAVGVTLLIVLTGNSDQQAAPPVSSAPAGPAPQPGNRAPSSSSPALPNVQPSIAGWQSVSAPAEKVAYDVPPDWKVESPGTLTGFENQSGPLATMHSVATYKDGQACPASPSGSYRTHTGMMKLVDIDPQNASVAGSILWANAALEKPAEDRSLPTPSATQTKVANGTLDAWTASTTITPLPDQCSAPSQKVTTVAFVPPGQQLTAVFVMYSDQQVADALPDAVAGKVIGTLRPIG